MEFRRDLKATLAKFMQNIAKRASRERARLASLAGYAKYVNLSLTHSLSRSGQTSLVFLVTGKTLKTPSHEYIAIQIVIFENLVKPGQRIKEAGAITVSQSC